MPHTLKRVVELVSPKIEKLLNRHKSVLGAGREFVVSIGVRQTRVVSVVVPEKSVSKLSKSDWNQIFSRKWGGKYQLALECIRNNGNRPTSVKEVIQATVPDFYAQDRDRMNRTLKKAKLPFFVRNTTHGISHAHLQVVRR